MRWGHLINSLKNYARANRSSNFYAKTCMLIGFQMRSLDNRNCSLDKLSRDSLFLDFSHGHALRPYQLRRTSMPPSRKPALFEAALPAEQSLRLTQSGKRFFLEIFDGSTRLERAPVKPTRSRDALQEKLQQPLPQAIADEVVAKLIAAAEEQDMEVDDDPPPPAAHIPAECAPCDEQEPEPAAHEPAQPTEADELACGRVWLQNRQPWKEGVDVDPFAAAFSAAFPRFPSRPQTLFDAVDCLKMLTAYAIYILTLSLKPKLRVWSTCLRSVGSRCGSRSNSSSSSSSRLDFRAERADRVEPTRAEKVGKHV